MADQEKPQEDFSKLDIDAACNHKVWKARLEGYIKAKKKFEQIDGETSPEWNKFVSIVKKCGVDSHALCQEKGLEATLVFIDRSSLAAKVVHDVVPGVIQKTLAAPKARTKELGAQVLLMFVELDKQDIVVEELIKGSTESKNPKVASACIQVLNRALHEFGPKVINVSLILRTVLPLIDYKDPLIREETRLILNEMYHWLGPALKPQLSSAMKPHQFAKIEAYYETVKDTPAKATRKLRSQQLKAAATSNSVNAAGDGDTPSATENVEVEETDPYDLLDPVDILSKMDKEFYVKLESKKWIERRDVLEDLDKLLQASPKLESGDYADLIRALKKVISKDSNVVVVACAVKCVTGISKGLKKKFAHYAGPIMLALFEKFKERKANVTTALKEAVDAVILCTTIEAIQEEILSAFANKNPFVRAEVAAFLNRCFCHTSPDILNKKPVRVILKGLVTILCAPDPNCRDNAAMALGTAMKVVGERNMSPLLTDADAFALKKVQEYYETAQVVVKISPPKPVAKATPAKSAPAKTASTKVEVVPTVKPKAVKNIKKDGPASSTMPVAVVNVSDALELAKTVVPSEIYEDMLSPDVEKQNSACERLTKFITSFSVDEKAGQILLSLFSSHDFSEANSNLIMRLNILTLVAEKFPLPREKVDLLSNISNHLTNADVTKQIDDFLTLFANKISVGAVAKSILPDAIPPKETEELSLCSVKLNWICSYIKNVEFLHDPHFLIGVGKKACESSDAVINNAGVKLIGLVYLKFDTQTDQEPCSEIPKGTITKSHSATPIQERDPSPAAAPPPEKPVDLPKTDIGPKLTEALLGELADKNWKVRLEAVDKVQMIVNSAVSITPNLGDAAPIIAARIHDSNVKISGNAIALVQSLAPAMGPACKRHIGVFLPCLMKVIGDQKPRIRSAVIDCFNVWGDTCGYDKFFEGEVIADALKSGTPAVRAELWSWLSAKLPGIPPRSIPKEELTACLSTLYSNLEDRNADVRKNAQEATLGVMLHLGYNNMVQALENIKGSGTSARVIKDILDKTRGSLPVQPLQKSKSSSGGPPDKSSRASIAKMTPGSSATIVKKSKKSIIPAKTPQTTRQSKTEEEDDHQPLLAVNNLKHQRVIDEQKMKVLKWTFTSVRPEFIELLKEQMIAANVNKVLLGYMFHADFRFHLRAIECLTEDIGNKESLKSNLDLILRWMTLKFYDTNPSVLLKALEYLNTVFNILIDDSYIMLDSEVAAFVPSLIMKAGDPKDAVRNSVRLILKQIASVYPANKQFSYLMDGLKSKNSRQRSECLDQLGWLIETYGTSVFHPSMPSALKDIAKQIADRDNAVRNSALNCVVQAYYLEGEKVYRMVGQISDKDMSLLEERIKRAAKNRPSIAVKALEPSSSRESVAVNVSPPSTISNDQTCNDLPLASESTFTHIRPTVEPEMTVNLPDPSTPYKPVSSSGLNVRPTSAGAYGIDRSVVAGLECNSSKFNAPKLLDIDLQFLNDSSNEASGFKPIKMSKVTPTISTYSQPKSIKRELVNIASGDIDKAFSAIGIIDKILMSEMSPNLNGHIDHYVSQLSHLMVILSQSSHPEVVNCYTAIFGSIIRVCSIKEFCNQISEATLYKILEQFLLLLTEPRLDMEKKQNMFGRAVNNIIIRFLENSNKTNLVCALLKILYSCVNNPKATNHFKDLLVKCLWKVNRAQPEWDSELDYARILSEFNTFWKDYPTSWWKNEEFDLPLRTVKTLLHSMVRLRGTAVRDIADKVPSISKDSELYIYIRKLIKHLKLEECHKAESSDDTKENIAKPQKEITQIRLTKEEQDELGAIFRMIGDFTDSTQGLKRLFSFVKNRSQASVDPFLSKTTPQFQNYVRRGLKALECEIPIKREDSVQVSPESNQTVKESEFTEEAGVVWNKLKNIQEISGYQCDRGRQEVSERTKEPPTSMNQNQNSLDVGNSDFESLKARVEKIKSAK